MNTYQIRIDLARYRPKIWRRLLIRSDLPLSGFHLAIQIAMGWENSHLHQFIKDKNSTLSDWRKTGLGTTGITLTILKCMFQTFSQQRRIRSNMSMILEMDGFMR